ncbi:MAG: extracellular solute-binding protein [Rickettsiales bacterium]
MKIKLLLKTLAFFTLILTSVFCFAAKEVVNVYSWSSYISQETIRDFEKKHKIKINYDVYDSNEMLDAKLLAGNTGYDLVFPSDNPFLKNQIKLGIYQELDKKLLPNIKNMDPLFLNMMSKEDPGNKYAMPWLWGLTGFAINKEKVLEIDPDAPIDSLELIFNPKYAKKIAKCGINFLDSATEIIPLALLYHGFNPNTTDPDELKKAGETLKAISPYIKTFNSSSYDDLFVDDSVCVGISWSGDIVKANEKLKAKKSKTRLSFVLPKEGFLMATDTMAIPKDAPNKKNAYILLNYLMEAKVAANNSNYTKYYNGNKASYKYLEKDLRDNKPNDSTLLKGYRIDPYPPKTLRLVNRIWTGVITGN